MIRALCVALIRADLYASTKKVKPYVHPVWRLTVAYMADDTQTSADQPPKTAKQLKKEEEKKAKLTKFQAKKEAAEKKEATAEVRATRGGGGGQVGRATAQCSVMSFVCYQQKKDSKKEKQKEKQVIEYNIPTPAGQKKGEGVALVPNPPLLDHALISLVKTSAYHYLRSTVHRTLRQRGTLGGRSKLVSCDY